MKNFERTTNQKQKFLLMTCAFLAKGGDGYPKLNVVDYAFPVKEQDLVVNALERKSPITYEDGSPLRDTRIQNILFREDTLTP